MENTVEYANWWSRVLCQEAWDRQFFIPVPPPSWSRRTLEAAERICFPAERIADRKVEKPVFIIGLPRSGTTMLYNLLCAHENAAYVTNCMNVYPTALNTIEWLRRALNLNIKGERYLHDSLDVEFGGPSELMTMWGKWTGRKVEDFDWESHPVEVTPAMIAQAHLDFRRVLAAFPQATRIVSKNPVLQTELPAIQALFPDARFIHIVRDGRMVANSLVKLYRLNNQQLAKIHHPELSHIFPYPKTRRLKEYMDTYGPDSLECAARSWQDTVQLVRQTAPALDGFYEVRYEDLLASPREETEKLLAFCELPWPSESNQAFHAQFGTIGKIRHENRYGNFDVVERVAQDALRMYGYAAPSP